jgi:hypothetical protein
MDVRSNQEALIDTFERIENFFRRLEVYTEVPPTPEMIDYDGEDYCGGPFYSWDHDKGDRARPDEWVFPL